MRWPSGNIQPKRNGAGPAPDGAGAGNLKQDGNVQGMYRQYSYDAEGHVTKQIDIMGNVENDTYNALGQVVESVTPSYQLDNFYDPFGMGIASWCRPSNNWCGPEIHLGAGGMILGWDAFAPSSSAQTEFLHKDALGSTRLGTNYAGAPLGDQLFYPWGDMWSVQGAAQDPAGFAGFLGALDTDGVLYGTLNREYAHTMGRWLTPDPLAGDVNNPQSLNRYAYVMNNPATLTDPLGLRCVQTGTDANGNPIWGDDGTDPPCGGGTSITVNGGSPPTIQGINPCVGWSPASYSGPPSCGIIYPTYATVTVNTGGGGGSVPPANGSAPVVADAVRAERNCESNPIRNAQLKVIDAGITSVKTLLKEAEIGFTSGAVSGCLASIEVGCVEGAVPVAAGGFLGGTVLGTASGANKFLIGLKEAATTAGSDVAGCQIQFSIFHP